MKLFGKILFWLGVLSLILGIIGAVLTGSKWDDVQDMLSVDQEISGTATVAMESGETRSILAKEGVSGSCDITAPDGTDVPFDANTAPAVDGWSMKGVFTAPEAGDYTIDCGDAGFGVSEPLAIGDALWLGLGVLAAVFLLPLGLLLMLIGGLLWFFGRKKDRPKHSNYTNGEYSDQFSRSAPYSQRDGQVPPGPGQYDDRNNTMGYGAAGAGAAGAGAAGAYGVTHDDGDRRDGRVLDGERPQYGERAEGGYDAGQPVRDDRGFGEPVRDDRAQYGEPVRDDRGFGRPLDDRSPGIDGDRRDDRGDLGGHDDRGDRPWNGGGTTPPPPPRGN